MNFILFRSPIYLSKPGSTTFGYDTESYPPLGLLYIAGALENDGHKVEIIDLSFDNPSKESLIKKLSKIDAIGLEVYSDNYEFVANYAKKLKEINSNNPIIIGGPHCIYFQEKSLDHISAADIAVIGDGEKTIVDLAEYLQGKKKIFNIHNIFYRENGNIKAGRPYKNIENLDDIPFPARHLIEKYNYDKLPKGYSYKKRLTLMTTSRGCPYSCRFCARYNNMIKDYGYQQRSAENVVKEIVEIDKKYGSVLIVDDNFLADKKRSHLIFDMLIKHSTNIEILIMGARVDSADKNLFLKMKKANVTYISFGIESGNQDVLDFYEKNITLNQTKRAVKMANKIGFQTAGTIMFGAPIETKKHLKRTLKFVKSLPLDLAIFTILKYCRGSSLWYEAVKDNKINEDSFYEISDSRKGLGKLTSEELIEFSRYAFKSFYIRPKYIYNQFKLSLRTKDFSKFKNLRNFLSSLN